MRLAVAGAILLMVSGMTVANARSKVCYRHAEAVADQAIRYTTEVMVMSDTCRNDIYGRFALRNRRQIIAFQEILKRHYRRIAGRHAQARLDGFMTHIANEEALRTATQDMTHVCAVATRFLSVANTLSGSSFRRYVEHQARMHDHDYRFCKK
ncbi:MAG: hypothetical protein ACREFD_13385 [Stellaceae bacterium]